MSDVHLRWGRCIAALLLCAAAGAQADSDIAGQVRVRWDDRQPSGRGPLTLASQLAPELVPPPASSGAIESELRGHWRMLHVSLAARQEHPEGGAWHSDATVNELYAGGEAAGWHLSAGRKIVSWDVGYGFRPNDIVQQETRRTLLTSTPQGRAVLQAERFDADSAWSLVWINPQRPRNGDALARGPDEQALAMRLYRHDGSADWHGFARLGERTRGSVGAAVSWVATDTLELHASARWAERSDAIAQQPAVQGLVGSNPYREVMLHGTTQALIGANWTGENKLSLMAEAWFDGTAPSNAQWSQWSARNASLVQMLSPVAPEPGAGRIWRRLTGAEARAHATAALERLT